MVAHTNCTDTKTFCLIYIKRPIVHLLFPTQTGQTVKGVNWKGCGVCRHTATRRPFSLFRACVGECMNKETIIDRIRNRFPPAEAEEIINSFERARGDAIFSYMLMRHDADFVEDYRQKVRGALRQYRQWRYRDALASLAKTIHDREGEMLREAAKNAASLYLDARRDHRDLYVLVEAGQNIFEK